MVALAQNRPIRDLNKKNPAISGASYEAAEGTRTLDLLHGKQTL
jgi:hypothetical protein